RHHGHFFHRLLDFVAAASRLIYEHVMHDREQPRPQIASRAPEIELVPSALQGVLNQVVGEVAVADESAGVTPQPGNVLDDEATIHLPCILALGRFFRERSEGIPILPTAPPKKENLRYKRAAWRIYSAGCDRPWSSPGAARVNTSRARAIPDNQRTPPI